MSDLLLEVFNQAMEQLPFTPDPKFDRAEQALKDRLGQEGKAFLDAYENAFRTQSWEDLKQIFFVGLALGIELGRLTPCADACRR